MGIKAIEDSAKPLLSAKNFFSQEGGDGVKQEGKEAKH